MINHARTLLLNIPSTAYLPGMLGEEYIPTYAPVVLPSYLALPHKILFGANPDKVFMNFRAHELLSLIHQTELAEFIYALDPRVTYWPQNISPFYTAQKQLTYNRTAGAHNARIYFNGQINPDNMQGRAFREYYIQLISEGTEQKIKVTAEASKKSTNELVPWMSNGENTLALTAGDIPISDLSAPIPLFDSDLEFRVADIYGDVPQMLLEDFDADDLPPFWFLLQETDDRVILETDTTPEVLAMRRRMEIVLAPVLLSSWTVRVYSRPGSAVTTCLPQLEFLGEPTYLELFGVQNNIEPYATFKNIWFDNSDPGYRLAAFTLAMIYRTNELKNG